MRFCWIKIGTGIIIQLLALQYMLQGNAHRDTLDSQNVYLVSCFSRIFRKTFSRVRIDWTEHLCLDKDSFKTLKSFTKLRLWLAIMLDSTWTCQVSGSLSFRYIKSLKPMISGILWIFNNESSDFFNLLTPLRFAAFNQRSSKFIRTSYAAGPSILAYKSCHGCLGPLLSELYKWKHVRNSEWCWTFQLDKKITLQIN